MNFWGWKNTSTTYCRALYWVITDLQKYATVKGNIYVLYTVTTLWPNVIYIYLSV